MLRDGMHQTYVHEGIAPYRPNSLDGGCPFMAGEGDSTRMPFIDFPEHVAESAKERRNPATFEDHFSQARLFCRSLDPVEQRHVRQAYSFELGKCTGEEDRARQLQSLANIDAELCAKVAVVWGLPAPAPNSEVPDQGTSAALSQMGGTWPVDGGQDFFDGPLDRIRRCHPRRCACSGLPSEAPGVRQEAPERAVAAVVALLASHRVWEQFPPVRKRANRP